VSSLYHTPPVGIFPANVVIRPDTKSLSLVKSPMLFHLMPSPTLRRLMPGPYPLPRLTKEKGRCHPRQCGHPTLYDGSRFLTNNPSLDAQAIPAGTAEPPLRPVPEVHRSSVVGWWEGVGALFRGKEPIGKAVQVDNFKTCVDSACDFRFQRLKLQFDETLSKFALRFDLRRYCSATICCAYAMVRRCRFNRCPR